MYTRGSEPDPAVSHNRKLLVSVYNAQEAREAVLGGGRIIDSEDPKSALGNISPRHIMDISNTVLDCKRGLEVQLSTNIGEDQLLYRRSQVGLAIEKSTLESAGKAAQAAIGEVLSEVTSTLRRTESCSHCQVMSVLFAQNLDFWNERKQNEAVRRVLVGLREFEPAQANDPSAFDIRPFAVNTLRDVQTGEYLFTDPGQVSLSTLIRRGVLPGGSDSTLVRTDELFPQSRYFPEIAAGLTRTNQAVIKAMVDVTADSGATSIMIDTSVLTKVSNVCLVDTSTAGMVDINRFIAHDGLPLRGILPLEDMRFFVDYCHYRGLTANLAGSIDSFQAQQLWVLIPELDQASTRSSASGVDRDPSKPGVQGIDTRQYRVIKRALVRGLAPPEHGGVLNIPADLKTHAEAQPTIKELIERIAGGRRALGFPELQAFWVDRLGNPEPIN